MRGQHDQRVSADTWGLTNSQIGLPHDAPRAGSEVFRFISTTDFFDHGAGGLRLGYAHCGREAPINSLPAQSHPHWGLQDMLLEQLAETVIAGQKNLSAFLFLIILATHKL